MPGGRRLSSYVAARTVGPADLSGGYARDCRLCRIENQTWRQVFIQKPLSIRENQRVSMCVRSYLVKEELI